ncbi:uncharacterized protein LOC144175289 [Haemaphysalis longicornis]
MEDCMDCFDRVMFKNRPGIQTTGSIFFTMNSVLMMLFLYTALIAEDAAVHLKLKSVDSNPTEIKWGSSLVAASFYITSLLDLYLIIGIEDNSRAPMLMYMWWSTFTAATHGLGLLAIAIWKSNARNMSLVVTFVVAAGIFTIIRAFFARKVYRYSMLVLNPEFVAGEVAEMSAAAATLERIMQAPPTFSPRRDSDEYEQYRNF